MGFCWTAPHFGALCSHGFAGRWDPFSLPHPCLRCIAAGDSSQCARERGVVEWERSHAAKIRAARGVVPSAARVAKTAIVHSLGLGTNRRSGAGARRLGQLAVAGVWVGARMGWTACSVEGLVALAMEAFLLMPLLAAMVYASGAICLKLSTNDGVGPWRTTFFSNLALGLVGVPFWFLGEETIALQNVPLPLLASATYFVGQLLTCLAIHKGDVSVVTPLMGTKTIFVGALSALLVREYIPWPVWLGAFLSAFAIFILRGDDVAERRRLLPSIVLGLGSSLTFALNDVLIQRFGGRLGFEQVIAVAFPGTALLSFALIPLFSRPVRAISGRAWRWLGLGSVLLAGQAALVAIALSEFGRATLINIFYSSRGMWAVVLIWLFGSLVGSAESAASPVTKARRLLGAATLFAAMLVALQG